MKKWRVGTVSMGLALIFLGVGFLVHQFNPGLARGLIVNFLPLVLIALGGEILFVQYWARKREAGYGYDFLGMAFAFLVGLVGLGLYSLTAGGFCGDLAAAALTRPQAVAYRREFAPRGRVREVILETGSGWHHPVRVWDADGERITVIVHGFTRVKDDGESLAPVVLIEEVGEAVYVRLRAPYLEFPWGEQVDQAEVMIPPKYRLNARGCFNLNAEEFHGAME